MHEPVVADAEALDVPGLEELEPLERDPAEPDARAAPLLFLERVARVHAGAREQREGAAEGVVVDRAESVRPEVDVDHEAPAVVRGEAGLPEGPERSELALRRPIRVEHVLDQRLEIELLARREGLERRHREVGQLSSSRVTQRASIHAPSRSK
ncbi:MAG: hypothetical protein M5U28_50520 [Sandaracinaceae bacterium]|nr:hypothetical protein [Sandaracinaceae bacterium]